MDFTNLFPKAIVKIDETIAKKTSDNPEISS